MSLVGVDIPAPSGESSNFGADNTWPPLGMFGNPHNPGTSVSQVFMPVKLAKTVCVPVIRCTASVSRTSQSSQVSFIQLFYLFVRIIKIPADPQHKQHKTDGRSN